MLAIERSKKTFSYLRGGEIFEGRRGLLKIEDRIFHTVELVAKNHQPYVSLLSTKYVVEMARMNSPDGRRALRFLADGHEDATYPRPATFRSLSEGRIYVHGLNALILRPDHLRGCIGAGIEPAENGVRQSTKAMFEIFLALGGFKDGRRFEVEIRELTL